MSEKFMANSSGGGSQEHSIQATTKGRDCDKASRENIWSLETFHLYVERNSTRPLKQRDYKDPMVVIYELSDN